MIVRMSLGVIALLSPAVASAQTYKCSVPSAPMSVRPDLPSTTQPQRRLPIGGYTLAITWAPQYCHYHARDASARFQCASGNRFGFTLHGLWPDGVGKDWPQYCKSTSLIPRAVVAKHLCTTPSAQLLQHEWAKHGTCMAGMTPARYFDKSAGLYAKLRYPDMDALSRRKLTAGSVCDRHGAREPGAQRRT